VVELEIAETRPQAPLPAPFHTWALPDGVPWTDFHREHGGYLLRFPGMADFHVSADAKRVTCHPVHGTSDAVVQHLYLNQVLPLSLSKQGRLVFHASAVEVDGGAIAFVGVSGRGKSTLAASFAIEGFRFLTDDGLVVEPVGHGHVALPSHPSIRLWEDSEQALIAPGTAMAPAVDYTSKARFLAGDKLGFCDEPRPLRRVYFLGDGSASDIEFRRLSGDGGESDIEFRRLSGDGSASDIEFRRLSGADAMIEWVKHSFLLDIEEKPRLASHFDQVAKLANEPIHYALDYPRSYDELARVRAAIVAHARNPSG